MAQHISLKFQNDTAGMGLRLFSVGVKLHMLPERNVTSVNYKGNHVSLKFQNNTVSETFTLKDIGLGVVILTEQ